MEENKTCTICQQEKPLIEFSTLTRRQLDLSFTVGVCCSGCYWHTAVLAYPQHRIEDGKAVVDYLPRPTPHLWAIREMEAMLPGRLADEATQKAFAHLGDLEQQARPFRDFARELSMGEPE